ASASEPVPPYRSDTPIRKIAVAAPPSTRYFSAASALSVRWNASSTSTYTGMDMSSRPRNSVRKLSAESSRQNPYSDESSSTWKRWSVKSSRESSSTGMASASTTALPSAPGGPSEYWPGNGAPWYPAT